MSGWSSVIFEITRSETPDYRDFIATDAGPGEGKKHRAQIAAAKRPAQVHHMTRQQRRRASLTAPREGEER